MQLSTLMITKSQVIPMLVEAAPSFQATINKYLPSDQEEILYTLLGGFAHHLLQQY